MGYVLMNANNLRKLCDLRKKTVAIFYHPQIEAQLGADFPRQLADAGYNVLTLSLSRAADIPPSFLPVDQAELPHMDFLDACIGYQLPLWLTWGNNNMSSFKVLDVDRSARNSFTRPDTWLECMAAGAYGMRPLIQSPCAAPLPKVLRIPDSIKLPRGAVGPRTNCYIFPLVPSKFERIRALRAKLPASEINRILVCPACSDLLGYFVHEQGGPLIKELLQRYPMHQVVFRPRPEDRHNPEVQAIIHRFSTCERFLYDSAGDYTEQYARGVLLITDVSSTGQTFSLATHQPSFYFPRNNARVHITIPALRDAGCFVTDSLSTLLERAQELLSAPDAWKEQIARTEAAVYGENHSFSENFITYLDAVLHDRVHPDWYRIELQPGSFLGNTLQDYEASIISILDQMVWPYGLLAFILPQYQRRLRQQAQFASSAVIQKLLNVNLHHFRSAHAAYIFIAQPLSLALHNLKQGAELEISRQALADCASALYSRHPSPTAHLSKFWHDVASALTPRAGTSALEQTLIRLIQLRLRNLYDIGIYDLAVQRGTEQVQWIQQRFPSPKE